MGKRRSSFVASDDSGDERPAKITKKTKKGSSGGGAEVDANGDPFWELSNKRRVVVSKFNGNMLISVREYYEDKSSGEMKPGKKGISLSVEQFKALTDLIPAINDTLRKKGVNVDGKEVDSDDDEDPDEPAEKPAKASKKSNKERPASKKANIEATSDEEDD